MPARRLALSHPVTGAPMDFSAPLPADLAAALAAWQIAEPDGASGPGA